MYNFKEFLNYSFIFEELNVRQKLAVAKWYGSDKESDFMNHKLTNHIFPEGQDRIEIPVKLETRDNIENHLNQHGYQINSYSKGTAIDKHGRNVKIGKVLNVTKASDELKRSFENDDRKTTDDLHNHKIVISRHPYDIAGASTGRKWTSCAKINPSGTCSHDAALKMPHMIKKSMVAYLVHKDDDDIKNPVARVMIHPFHSYDSHSYYPKHTTYKAEERIYNKTGGAKIPDFAKSVNEFVSKQFPMKPGEIYKKDFSVYNDDAKQSTFDKSLSSIEKIRDEHGNNNDNYLEALQKEKFSPETFHKLIDYHDDNNLDRAPLVNLAKNRHLNEDHINKLLERNDSNINAALASRTLNEKHVDKLVNTNDWNIYGHLVTSNFHKLKDHHINHIIDKALNNESEAVKRIKNSGINNTKVTSEVLDYTEGTNVLKRLVWDAKPEHLNKVIDKTQNYKVLRNIVDNAKNVTNEQLEHIARNQKDKEYPEINSFRHPYYGAIDRLRKKGYTENDLKENGLV